MKALFCRLCFDVRALPPSGRVSCRCGNVTAEWADPRAGTARFFARSMPAHFIGMNNGFLSAATAFDTATPQQWRDLHERATDAPGYIFDRSDRACWAIVVQVGASRDTWYDDALGPPKPPPPPETSRVPDAETRM